MDKCCKMEDITVTKLHYSYVIVYICIFKRANQQLFYKEKVKEVYVQNNSRNNKKILY